MNKENYKLVLDKILENPACWKQSSWHCRTQHCFAGHAQILAGKPINDHTVRRDARMFLDMSLAEADYFFSGERTLDDFRAGYDRAGYNRAGYDQAGYDRAGYNRAGYNQAGYDQAGYNRDGYDRDGLDKNNQPKTQ